MPESGVEMPMYCSEVRWRELRKFCEGGLEPNIFLLTEKKTTCVACPD
jgi:hypothetical protein